MGDSMSTHDATPAAIAVRKVALASSLGATIEWYDFFIYGTVRGMSNSAGPARAGHEVEVDRTIR
jgi:hypothetical protein